MEMFKEKLVVSGQFVDLYNFSKWQFWDYTKFEKKSFEKKNLKRSIFAQVRASAKIRSLVNCNPFLNKFLTLNFAKNLQNLNEANYAFKKFMQRLKYKYIDFKYISVVEFQKRGAVHYHLVCNLPRLNIPKLQADWAVGQVDIERVRSVEDTGLYFVKNLCRWNVGVQFATHGTKDNYDEESIKLAGRKKFFSSRGLVQPIVYREEFNVKNFKRKNLKGLEPKFEKSWKVEGLTVNLKSFKI